MRMIVVLPAPLLPSSPTISLRPTWKLTLETANTGPKYLERLSTSIMRSVLWASAGAPVGVARGIVPREPLVLEHHPHATTTGKSDKFGTSHTGSKVSCSPTRPVLSSEQAMRLGRASGYY